VESVKSVTDVFLPIAGKITAFNEELESDPEYLNTDPYEYWLIELTPSDPKDLDKLMTAAQHDKLISE
jgi:glycine cleavage system H protein